MIFSEKYSCGVFFPCLVYFIKLIRLMMTAKKFVEKKKSYKKT